PTPRPRPRQLVLEGLEERTLLSGSGLAVFTPPGPLAPGSLPVRLSPLDPKTVQIRLDGGTPVADVPAPTQADGSVFGSFVVVPSARSQAGLAGPSFIAGVVDDFNGDGIPDVALSSATGLSLELGQGNGGFATVFQVGTNEGVAVQQGDIN